MTKKLNRRTAPADVRPIKVLQFGEGNFLRAFCDWIVDILNEKTNFNGAIQVVQPIRQGMGDLINGQEGLYHVVLNGLQQGQPFSQTRLITSVSSVLNPYEDYNRFLRLAENPDLQFIFSNTTEAGIAYSENDKSPDRLPECFPGKITALLHHRFQFFKGAPDKGLILLPCELIDKNGTTLKHFVDRFIREWNLSKDFTNWVDAYNIFCNTLVDRIVPGFPKETIHTIHQETGFEDNLVVMAEPFHLWVIEGPALVKDRLPVEAAGLQVKFVSDMAPYRTRKVRILNGAHTAMVPVAFLKGLRTVRESVEDPSTRDFILRAINEEIIPTLDLPRKELDDFAAEVMERFRNPFIRHELSSIALNSISKFKVRVLPSLIRYVELKKSIPERLSFSLAALIRFYKGDWNGIPLPVNDTPDVVEFFKKIWSTGDPGHVARLTLANVGFWDRDLNEIPGLTHSVTTSLVDLFQEEKSLMR